MTTATPPAILDRFHCVRAAAGGWMALCPAHADKNPSLSINEKDGKILLYCHAGCDVKDILAAIGMTFSDLAGATERKVVAEYNYLDEAGQTLYQVVRYSPKDFRQRRPDGVGGWISNLNGTRRVPYNLLQVIAAEMVFVVEGEKDAETAKGIGLVATCNVGGAGKWKSEYSDLLNGKIVVIVADADLPGRKHAREVAASLHLKTRSVKIIEMPSPNKDLSEFVQAIGASDPSVLRRLILAMAEDAPEWTPAHTLEVGQDRANLAPLIVTEAINLPDMPEAVLDGHLGEICKKRLGDFPIALSWLPLLTAAGVLVQPTNNVVRTNLYAAIVGPQHCGKSQAIERANLLMDLKPPIIEEVKPGSAEGLLKQLGDRQGSAVLLYPDELSHLLEKAQITNASFAYILNSQFYKDEAHLTIAHGAKVDFNCRLSLIGGIVDEKFDDSFGSATTGGLYDRFLFGQCPTGVGEYLYRPWEGPAAFDGQLADCRVNPDVWDARDEVAKKEKLNPRLLELSLRVAAICAAFDGRDELRAADLGPAWELARYQSRVRMLLKPNAGKNFEAQIAVKITNYLNRHAPEGTWLVLRQVLHSTRANDYGPSVANRALDAMTFAGSIEQTTQETGRGPKRRLVRLAIEAVGPGS